MIGIGTRMFRLPQCSCAHIWVPNDPEFGIRSVLGIDNNYLKRQSTAVWSMSLRDCHQVK